MKYLSIGLMVLLYHFPVSANQQSEEVLITQIVKNYLVAQHKIQEKLMDGALHEKLAKRTFWQSNSGDEFIMETSRNTMLHVARNYNKSGTNFPIPPRIEVKVFDIDKRVASVKLIADDWMDYMHLVKTESGDWKILNVLWQYHDINKHVSK